MRDAMGTRLRLAALALLLPLAFAAAAAAEDAQPAGGATPQAVSETPSGPPKGITGVILKITKDSVAVRSMKQGGRSFLTLAGGADTVVTGEKKSFDTLEAGDLVAVSYQGDPPKALGIRVLPPDMDPVIAAATGANPYDKRGREFVGWIKRIDAKTMVVRTPNPPQGSRRKAEIKTFARTDKTVVEHLRTSWDELKKGDRVSITFLKGEPRPAQTVKVVLIGGRKPLPPGLATSLYDPAYDQSVKDVDGIGEWPPDKPWPGNDAKASATQPAR